MATRERRRILIVEDDASLADSLGRLLEHAGFAVETKHNGTDAVDCAEARRPDLVILDLKLPDIHGYQVAQELRRLYQPAVTPILMLTGLDQPIDKLRGYARGADAYLTKPCASEELLQAIHRLLEPVAL